MILRLGGNPFVKHMPEFAQQLFEQFPSLVQIDHLRRDGVASISSESSASSDDGNFSVSSVKIMPLSGSSLFGPLSRRFEDEVERFKQQLQQSLPSSQASFDHDSFDSKLSEAFEAQHIDGDASVDPEQYEQQRKLRMVKWKEQLDALATRKAELEEDARPVITRSSGGSSCTSVFSFSRSRAMERAHETTDAAIADAASHFQQVFYVTLVGSQTLGGKSDESRACLDGAGASGVAAVPPTAGRVAFVKGTGTLGILRVTLFCKLVALTRLVYRVWYDDTLHFSRLTHSTWLGQRSAAEERCVH
jgi:hypothetical protein